MPKKFSIYHVIFLKLKMFTNKKKYKKVFCFDFDGVIAKTKKNHYSTSLPKKKNISVINLLYKNGYYIKIYTARFMGRTNDNSIAAKKLASDITLKQLKNWKVKYHKVYFGKPSFDFFVDDKSIFYKKNWSIHIKKKFLSKNKY